MDRESLSPTQRRPIAASVRAPTAIRSSMVFFRNTGVRVPDVLSKGIVFSLMLGIACSFALAQEQNVPLATASANDTKASLFVSDLLSKMTLEENLAQMSQIAYKNPHSVS